MMNPHSFLNKKSLVLLLLHDSQLISHPWKQLQLLEFNKFITLGRPLPKELGVCYKYNILQIYFIIGLVLELKYQIQIMNHMNGLHVEKIILNKYIKNTWKKICISPPVNYYNCQIKPHTKILHTIEVT